MNVVINGQPPVQLVLTQVAGVGPPGPAGDVGEGAVESVNGQTGEVVLDAADVGAATEAQGAKADTAVQPAALTSAIAALSSVYQPVDSDLTAIAALTTTSYGRALLALADAAAGRTALGLGTAATQATSAFDAAGSAASAQAASQPLDSDLTAIAALTTTSFGRSLLEAANAGALRTLAGLVIGTDVQAYDADLAAIAALTTTSYGRAFLALADAAALRTAGGLVIGTDVQAYDAELAALAGLSSAANKLPYFTGSATAALADLTAAGRTLIAGADAAAMRSTLGVSAATLIDVITSTSIVATNTTTLQNTALSIAVAANVTYRLQGCLIVSAATAADAKAALSLPTSATAFWGMLSPQTGATANTNTSARWASVNDANTLTIGTVGAGATSVTDSVSCPFSGIVTVAGTAGNVVMQVAQSTQDNTDLRVFAGSWMELTPIT